MRPTTLAGLTATVLAGTLAAGCGSSSTTNSAATTSSATPTSSSAVGSGSGSGQGGSGNSGGGQGNSASPPAPHATEFNPPGDIPDNAVFIDHTAPGTRVHFKVPEGWAKSSSHGVTTYTDKYNSISIEVQHNTTAPTVASARTQELPALRSSVPNLALQNITEVTRQHGSAVHVVYLLDSPPNPVTNKVVRDKAERFEFWHGGQEAILTLTGPENADNVDPWKIVSDSLQWK